MKTLHLKYQPVNSLHFYFWLLSVIVWNFILNPYVRPLLYQIDSIDSEFLITVVLLGLTLPILISILRAFKLVSKPIFYSGLVVFFITLIASGIMILSFFKPETDPKINWYRDLNWNDLFKSINEIAVSIGDFFIHKVLYVLIFHLTIVLPVYINLNHLIPKVLNFRKFTRYALWLSALIVSSSFINYFLFNFIIDPIFPSLYYISYFRIWELNVIILNYLAFTTFVFLVWQYASYLISSQQKTQNELSALKAQINPHFLFNNLNTIYSMAERNDSRTSQVVLKLSDFLRYVLYDTSSDWILLENEVDILKTYVDLQKERLNPELVSIEFTSSGEMNQTPIAPLLLLPIAENCFKHGIGQKHTNIVIFIGFDGKQLTFRTKNKVFKTEKENKPMNNGIGLQNVEQRLKILYPGSFSFKHEESDGVYTVELLINLK